MCQIKQTDREKTRLIIPIKRNVDQNEDQLKAFSVIWIDQNHYMNSLHLRFLYEMATEMDDRDLLIKFQAEI